jgi:tetratricopeptide (TPR) repeat protein
MRPEIALANPPALIGNYISMEISLAGARQRTALVASSILVAALVSWQAGKLWLASRWLASDNLSLVERAAALTPGDGSAWDGIGHLRQWSLSHPDLPGAIADYRRALRDDPLSAHYWMDLASAYELSGDDARARDAFVHGVDVYPDSAEVAFYYGNFLLRRQEYPAAFAELRRAVSGDVSLLPLAISRAWRATGDVDQLLDRLLPPNVGAYVQALDYFSAIAEGNAALSVWSRLVSLGKTVPLPSTFPFIDELIREDRGGEAHRVWLQAVAAAGWQHSQPADGSVMWNGDFAANFANGGLGWRWDAPLGVSIEFDSAPAQGGSRSVRLDFNGGSNVNLDAPFEYVPVEPGRPYHFHALLRTDEVTTDSGVRFSIGDPNHIGVVNVITDNFIGNRGWTPVDADLTAGPSTHFLVVRLIRIPSRFFDNKIGGTAWFADVSLVPMNAQPGPGR